MSILPANTAMKLSVYNVLGEVVKSEEIIYNGQSYGLSLTDLQPGVYVIRAEAKGSIYTKNFMKQ
jgi:hypothetical protein